MDLCKANYEDALSFWLAYRLPARDFAICRVAPLLTAYGEARLVLSRTSPSTDAMKFGREFVFQAVDLLATAVFNTRGS